MKKLMIFLIALMSFSALAQTGSYLTIRNRRVVVRQQQPQNFMIGSAVSVDRVYFEAKSPRRNSFVQVIVNGRIVRNVPIHSRRYEPYNVFVGEFTSNVSFNVVNGRVKVRRIQLGLSDTHGPNPNPGTVLPIHHGCSVRFLMEDLMNNVNNLRGILSLDEYQQIYEIWKKAAIVLSILGPKGGANDQVVALLKEIIQQMEAADPIMQEVMERVNFAYLAINFNSIKESLKMRTL